MKVGRREFLKLAGSAAASAVVPFRTVKKDDEGEWHHVARTQDEDGIERHYIDIDGEDVTCLSLDEYAARLGIRWIPSAHDRDDCPTCRELSGKPWVEPELPPEPEYDCDCYYPISKGETVHLWINPLTGRLRRVTLRWADHGLHTSLMANGCYLGKVLTRDLPDPGAYLRSIWSAGVQATSYILNVSGEP